MISSIEKICVFCASSPKLDEKYFSDAYEIGKILANNDIHVIYGGGGKGLMGALADSMLEEGGKITGIIPGFMKEMEWGHKGITELIEVGNMHERKNRMISESDAILAMPGGVGTLEELTEVITLKQLGQYFGPIIILNTQGYFNDLLKFFEQMISKKFMRLIHQQIWQVIQEPGELISALQKFPPWDRNAITFASVDD